jgi:hypothetical protein
LHEGEKISGIIWRERVPASELRRR